MPRPHAPFCDLNPDPAQHGPWCISRPIARQAVASNEAGKSVEITVDLAASWSDVPAPWLVRMVSEPPDIMARFVSLMLPGTARQVAAALVIAAGQAEELDHAVTKPRTVGRA